MVEQINLADIRKSYTRQALSEESILTDPIAQFEVWLQEAIMAQAEEPTAMVLSTANAAGRPSARVVLLKGLENGQFIFFTNYQGRKGKNLAENNFAALTFFWPVLERQVRIEGEINKVSESQSDIYFASRPRGSQIGAWVSPQSQEIKDRQTLEKATEVFMQQFGPDAPITRPPHWGGFNLTPTAIEFWQGRPNRLHDRLIFTRETSTTPWRLSRLAP